MNPFYDHDGITIYNADCADVLPLVPPDSVDLLLTDPPYGMNYRIGFNPLHEGVVNDDRPFDPAPLLTYGRVVVFGANHFTDKLPVGGWLVWSKNYRSGGTEQMPDQLVKAATAELAWTNCTHRVDVFNHWWAGGLFHRESERGVRYHPTQKPLALMRWIVDRWTRPGDLVFDPYMGSGPVARACADLGRRYIGVEVVEEYCQTAVDRLGQLSLGLG